MLTDYLREATARAKYKILEDGAYFGSIEDLSGVWANDETLSIGQQELQATVEDWLILGLKLGHHITPIGNIDLNEPLRVGHSRGTKP